MWNEYTPPVSPIYAESASQKPRLAKTRSTLMKERSSTYYADLISRDRRTEDATGSELEHGWAATSNALREAAKPLSGKHNVPGAPLPVQGNPSLAELASIDIDEKSVAGWTEQEAAESTKSDRWTLFCCLGRKRKSKSAPSGPTVSDKTQKMPSTHSSADLQKLRDARHDFLAKRQARGSIMYDRESGIAQIPLYAAPRAAQVAGAPALSSFAPRAPLAGSAKRASSASWADQSPVSKASATVDADGNVISVNKRQSYAKDKGRFSRFLDADSQRPLPPLPPLPNQYKP